MNNQSGSTGSGGGAVGGKQNLNEGQTGKTPMSENQIDQSSEGSQTGQQQGSQTEQQKRTDQQEAEA